MPAFAALAFSVLCNSSGTFRTWIIFDMRKRVTHAMRMYRVLHSQTATIRVGRKLSLEDDLGSPFCPKAIEEKVPRRAGIFPHNAGGQGESAGHPDLLLRRRRTRRLRSRGPQRCRGNGRGCLLGGPPARRIGGLRPGHLPDGRRGHADRRREDRGNGRRRHGPRGDAWRLPGRSRRLRDHPDHLRHRRARGDRRTTRKVAQEHGAVLRGVSDAGRPTGTPDGVGVEERSGLQKGGLVERLLAGDRRALARVISKIEREDEETAEIIAEVYKETGDALTVGFTGPPGVGKSSIIAKLIELYREEDRRVGVVSVDPSSPFSKGAILGDRVRLSDHFLDSGVFIRSMGSRGHLGGLAGGSRLAAIAMEAGGYDVIFYETVGVGQGEVEVASAADTVVLCLQPGAGDAVQALKAGVMEIADVFCINKADNPQA